MLKPQKACDAKLEKIVYPAIMMPKVDGIRALYINGEFQGRTLNKFANINLEYFQHPDFHGFDGELVYGDWTSESVCRDTTSGTNTIKGPSAEGFVWHIFDDLSRPDLMYQDRLYSVQHRVRELNARGFENIKAMPHKTVKGLLECLELHAEHVARGFEGSILRHAFGSHRNGRATVTEGSFLRIKDFIEEEALVLSVEEGDKNMNEAKVDNLGHTKRSTHQENKVPNGMVGRLICKDLKTGQTITVAPGRMTHAERVLYFENQHLIVGQYVKYKCMPYGKKDLPRFPTFQMIRPASDIVRD